MMRPRNTVRRRPRTIDGDVCQRESCLFLHIQRDGQWAPRVRSQRRYWIPKYLIYCQTGFQIAVGSTVGSIYVGNTKYSASYRYIRCQPARKARSIARNRRRAKTWLARICMCCVCMRARARIQVSKANRHANAFRVRLPYSSVQPRVAKRSGTHIYKRYEARSHSGWSEFIGPRTIGTATACCWICIESC